MDPQDDPEARIRDLERPLSDVARASELGAAPAGGSYGNPPPAYGNPPPGPFGAPFPSAPPTGYYGTQLPGTPPPAGFRGWWYVVALFVIVFLALAGGVAVFAAHMLSSRNATGGNAIASIPGVGPSPSGGGGSLTSVPSSGSSTPSSATQAPISGPPGGQLSVAGIGENQAIVCNDSSVDISGISNTVVITGHCASLTVSGGQNVVTVDTSDAISASGFNNKVTFHSGSPHVDNSGDSNVIQQG